MLWILNSGHVPENPKAIFTDSCVVIAWGFTYIVLDAQLLVLSEGWRFENLPCFQTVHLMSKYVTTCDKVYPMYTSRGGERSLRLGRHWSRCVRKHALGRGVWGHAVFQLFEVWFERGQKGHHTRYFEGGGRRHMPLVPPGSAAYGK